MSNRLLLALQFHEGDKAEAMALARLIADLLPEKTDLADLLFYAKYDASHDQATIDYCSARFTVHQGKSNRKAKGWPIGPNAMVLDLFKLVHEQHVSEQWDYSGVMLIEADCVPLRSTWLDELYAEWHATIQMLLGPWVGSKQNPLQSHMNGNLIYSPRLTKAIPSLLHNQIPVMAWDVYFWRQWRHLARPSKLIFSDYRAKFEDCERLFSPRLWERKDGPLSGKELRPAWLHGYKGMAALECVRKKLLAIS